MSSVLVAFLIGTIAGFIGGSFVLYGMRASRPSAIALGAAIMIAAICSSYA